MKGPLLILITGAAAAAVWYGWVAHHVPAGQPPMAAMDLASLRTDFNRAIDRPRLIVLLSPT